MKKSENFFIPFIRGLRLIPSCLFSFIKKVFPNAWIYCVISFIPLLISLLARSLVEAFTQNRDAGIMVFKILNTIGQIIPLSTTLYITEYELIDTDEGSAEICFTICALVIVALWQ